MGKKTTFIIIFLLILLSQAHSSDKKVIIATCEYPPYYGEKLNSRGFITEIVVEAFKRGGYKTQIDFYPWKRALITTKNGINDAIYTIWPSKEREKWFLFSSPLPPNELVFYKNKTRNVKITGYKDLDKYTVGIVRGYKYPKKFNEIEKFRKIEAVDDFMNLFNLAREHVDIIIIDKIQAKYLIKKKFPSLINDLSPVTPAIEVVNQYLAISKKVKNAYIKLDAFNTGLKKMREDGTVTKIMKMHGF